jgi:26S proteasome regulatory subunit N2
MARSSIQLVKISATAALGVIHKGYFKEGMTILGPYLPQVGDDSQMQGAAYSEGGALYALGLIHAGCGSGWSVEGYLWEMLRAAQGKVVQHGGALGLGVAGMGGKNPEAYDDLKQTLFMDSDSVYGLRLCLRTPLLLVKQQDTLWA